jgi:tetratricopeptide (TPR) repeat protein
MHWIGREAARSRQFRVELARQAVSQRPGDAAAAANFGSQLIASGAGGEAVDVLRAATAALPPSAMLHFVLARALNGAGDREAALAHAEQAVAIDPSLREAIRLRLHLLAMLGKTDQLAGFDLTPFAAESFLLMEFQTLALGPDKALALCDQVLAEKPAHGDAQYLRALALARLGRAAEARAIIDLERDVVIVELQTPGGQAGGETFRAALAAEVLAHPSLAFNPTGRSARDLSATRDLSRERRPTIDALMACIRTAVDSHEMALDPAGRFYQARPPLADISIWASVNNGGGFQASHRHPDGWLSGVYYVTAPRSDGANVYRGPLLLGALNGRDGIADPPWGVREIEPVPGRLVLFPSYMPHATAPTQATEPRISIAFDVVAGQPRYLPSTSA